MPTTFAQGQEVIQHDVISLKLPYVLFFELLTDESKDTFYIQWVNKTTQTHTCTTQHRVITWLFCGFFSCLLYSNYLINPVMLLRITFSSIPVL